MWFSVAELVENVDEFPHVISSLSIMSHHRTRAEALIPCDFRAGYEKHYREILIIH